MYQANAELRRRMRAENLPIWRISRIIGVHEKTLLSWLRIELDNKKKRLVNGAIDELIRQRGDSHE
jgi:hypothetical protein